ncbi:cyclopropane-fatty-acyl-phospholipid synthase [Nostoc sp. CENA543]|nr:cyclopropane-fatty-acyl-phospholipid synthase [Nostoc sp. CENA543]
MKQMVASISNRGGSAAAIQHHYDVSNEFYQLWLDSTLTYSSGLWDSPTLDDDLEAAQHRKIDWHLQASGATTGKRLLDIGCGWGALMQRHIQSNPQNQATGLTLSHNQYLHIRTLNSPQIQVCEESWIVHQPTAPYDAIVSIGAFEHFAQPEAASDEKISVYREFFSRCQQWLKPKGKLSLQTIAYGSLNAEDKNVFTQTEIFPDSELPRPGEIFIASDGLFEVKTYRNDRLHYGKTCDLWLKNLRRQKPLVIEQFGEELYLKYEQYLKLAVAGFYFGQILLLRFEMQSLAK